MGKPRGRNELELMSQSFRSVSHEILGTALPARRGGPLTVRVAGGVPSFAPKHWRKEISIFLKCSPSES